MAESAGPVGLCLAFAVALFAAAPARAQSITIDGSLAPARTLAGPNYTIGADLGKQVGGNLFHSFGQFGLAIGESATFTGPPTVANIIGRVTGGSPSSLDGAVRSNIAGASLYLINPSGIVFGSHATVDVSGGFYASTASYLRMSDGARFRASDPSRSTFGAAPPAAFGFLRPRPAAITVDGSSLGPVPGTLGLVGGPVAIADGTLTAPAGSIRIAAVAGIGELPVHPGDRNARTATGSARVDITGGSLLEVGDPTGRASGGSVFVRAGALTVDGSVIDADNYGAGNGGRLVLRGDRAIALRDGAAIHSLALADGGGADIVLRTAQGGGIAADSSTVMVGSDAAGSSGKLAVTAGHIGLRDGAALVSTARSTGPGGPIAVTAGPLSIGGALRQPNASGIVSQSLGAGSAGPIAVTAGSVSMTGFSQIGSVAFGAGGSGEVSLTAAGAVTIDATGVPDLRGGLVTDSAFVGIRSASAPGSAGATGNVSVSAATLAMRSAAKIGTGSSDPFPGGDVAVSVTGLLTLDRRSTDILSDAIPGAAGNAGRVSVAAGALSITDAGSITSSTSGPGNGGDVSINVAGVLSLTGFSGGFVSGIASEAAPGSTGNAGKVTVAAGAVTLSNTGSISTSTASSGVGGDVSVTVAGVLSIDGEGPAAAGIYSNAYGSGNAGQAVVVAGSMTLTNSGQILTNTFGSGNGGDVSVSVAGRLSIDGTFEGYPSGIFANADFGSTGRSGRAVVTAGTLSVTNGGTITSSTQGPGNGGGVSVNVAGLLSIDRSPEAIVASAEPGSSGDAGQVRVVAGAATLTNGGGIVSGTDASGDGGSVAVEIAGVLAIDGAADGSPSGIFARAGSGSSGAAGSVAVSAGAVVLTHGGTISSSTFAAGNGGDVLVAVAGPLTIDGGPGGVFANANPGSVGNAGSVTIVAGGLAIDDGGQVATIASGPGAGGDVIVVSTSGIALDGAGPQITALSTGTGDAGSVAVLADNLQLSNGARISTEAASANGGNIVLHVDRLLYLLHSSITTSVHASTGNGGNITIDPRLVVLNDSSVIAQAVRGHGGDIAITAGEFLASSDSIVSASSQLGISGTIDIDGPQVDVNGSLVALPSGLHAGAAVLPDACAGYGGRLQSRLVAGSRGGLVQDPDASLAALYLAGRDLMPQTAGIAAASQRFSPSQVRAAGRAGC